MKFKGLVAVVVTVFVFSVGAFAQETFNASDLVDKIKSALDLSFTQEDKIKPIVEEYVSVINKIESQGEVNEKSLRPQIKQVNQQLDLKLSQIFTPEQSSAWKSVKKQILPDEGSEGREANEAGEANERGGG